MKELKVISLFSGYGTQELALKYIGVKHKVVAHCDILTSANLAFESLHKTEIGNLGDITKLDEKTFPACDLLTYSFPCQDISISGVQRGIKKGTRSGLLFEVERIVRHNKPKYLLMENVKNLVSKNHMPAFSEYIKTLQEMGYGNSWMILNGADFGCPQNRERVFMFSVLGESSSDVYKTMCGVHKMKKERISMRSFIENTNESTLFINPPYENNTPKMASVCKLVARRLDIKYDQTRRIYGIDGASPCLTTSGSPQIMLDDKRIRTLTAREGYRFMGVKDNDIDALLTTSLSTKQHIALAGNSICVPVMEAIFTQFFSDYIEEGSENSPQTADADDDFFTI
jgi:site-specific DNA-cytosine methylase